MTTRTIDRASTTLPAKARRFVQAISSARRTDGLSAALHLSVSLPVEVLLRPVTRWQDARLDRRWGTDTGRASGPIRLDPVVAATAAYDDVVAYSPTPVRRLSRLLRRLPVREPGAFTFVDLGCGKGRALLLAAAHGYGRVIGVELDPSLVAAAHRNIKAFETVSPEQAGVIDVVLADATHYAFPPDPTVVFLFNPFGEDTLRAVVQRIERSVGLRPRPLVVAYCNPLHQQVLDASTVLQRTATSRVWTIYATAEISATAAMASRGPDRDVRPALRPPEGAGGGSVARQADGRVAR